MTSLQDQLAGIKDTASQIQSAAANVTPAASSQDTAIMSALQSTMQDSADLISSGDSGVQSAISNSIDAINSGQEASASRINTEAAQQSQSIQRKGIVATTDAVEGRRGFATQTAVFRDIMNTTNQELKDLDARRQDLILSGEADAASQIAGMQVQSLQLAQQAKQNAVTNLMSATNAMFNQRRLDMDEDAAARDTALQTIQTMQDIGTLKSTEPEDLANLEKGAGLPAGTLSNMPDVPANYEIRQVGNSLLAVDPADPTGVRVLYTAPKSTGGGSVNTLTIRETQDLGLPLTLAGLSEDEVVNSLAEGAAPDWFRSAEEAAELQTISNHVMTARWNNFRSGLLSRTAVPEPQDESFASQLANWKASQ